MNILILNWRDLKHSWAGGGEVYIFELASRWVKMGHKVTVFCGEDPFNKLPQEDTYKSIRIIRKGGRFSLYLWAPYFYLKYLSKETDIIVDVHNGIPFFSSLYSRVPKVAFVFHVHREQFFYELRFPVSVIGYLIEKYIFPFFYKNIPVVAISKTTKKDLIKIGFKSDRISVVYCGIKNGIKKRNIKNKFKNPTILYLGRIKSYKRVDLLIQVFEEILTVNSKARLIIAGWGTEASNITDLVMRSKLRRKIQLLGPVTDSEKRNLLSKSWIFANFSIGEGWGISVIEANLHGAPAVAFKVSGLSESIINHRTGLLAKDKKEMIININKLLSDKKYRDYLSKNAYEWALTFNWDKTTQKTLKILEKTNSGK